MKDRLKRLVISDELFVHMFSEGEHSYYVGAGAMPSDAKLVNVRHGWPNLVEVVLRSESFDEVNEGAAIPELGLTLGERPRPSESKQRDFKMDAV